MHSILATGSEILSEAWALLLDASVYIVFGLLVGGLLKVFLSPGYVARHLGTGRFSSVFKAALFGIPLPLCSCGVVPAAAALKREGASNGAVTAFLIATPESGVDSIGISWALLDPVMTVARPLAAFSTALVAGLCENLLHPPSAPVGSVFLPAGFGPGLSPGGEKMNGFQAVAAKLGTGIRYAMVELWGDMAGSFFIGLLFAGIVAVLVPDDLQAALGGGLTSMLVMLLVGIPLYTCATASTPIAAAFLLKGISPGAVLVFLLVGPATNIATITVLRKLLGGRSTLLYLAAIAGVSILCGLAVDRLYAGLGISARASVGRAAEVTPVWLQVPATLLLLGLSLGHLVRVVRVRWGRVAPACSCAADSPPGQPFLGDQRQSKGGNRGKGCGGPYPAAPASKERGQGPSSAR